MDNNSSDNKSNNGKEKNEAIIDALYKVHTAAHNFLEADSTIILAEGQGEEVVPIQVLSIDVSIDEVKGKRNDYKKELENYIKDLAHAEGRELGEHMLSIETEKYIEDLSTVYGFKKSNSRMI